MVATAMVVAPVLVRTFPSASSVVAGLIAAFAAVIWLASGFYIVDGRAAVWRFQEATELGPRWRLLLSDPEPNSSTSLVCVPSRSVTGSERNKVLKEA